MSIFNSLTKIHLRIELESGVGPTCFYRTIIKLRMFLKPIELKVLKIGQIADIFAKQKRKKNRD